MRSQQHILTLIIAFVILSAIGIGTAAYYILPAGLDCPSCTEDTVLQDSISHGMATAPGMGRFDWQPGYLRQFFVASALDSVTRDVLRGAVSLNTDNLLLAMIYRVVSIPS